jgi:site-specific DNA-methyltransferase (cytosine-N4-specific)
MTGQLWRPRDAQEYLYRRVGPVSLYLGPAHEVLAGMPADSVDTIVCSPPYWQLRDYSTGAWRGGDPSCTRHAGRRPRRRGPGDLDTDRCGACHAWWYDPQTGLEVDLDDYIAVLVHTLGEARRVLRPAGTLWLNLGDRYTTTHGTARPATILPGHDRDEPGRRVLEPKQLLGIPWRVALALQARGWWLRNAITWTKLNPSPESVTDRLSTTTEMLFLLTRSPRYFFDLDPIRVPLKHPQAADGSRIFGGANKGRHQALDSSARRRGNTYRNRAGTASGGGGGGGGGKYQPDATEPRMRAHRGNLAVTGAQHTAAHVAGRNPGDSWPLATRPYQGAHSAPFPIDIPLRAIAAGCPPGGHVLDPYSGAGTTGLAALRLGRRFSGIDVNPQFHDLALDRVAAHLPGQSADGGGG